MKKRIFASILLAVLISNMTIPVFATEAGTVEGDTPAVNGYLTITNPNTGEEWIWELPTSEVLISRSAGSPDSLYSAEVSVDVDEYLLQTVALPSTEKVQREEVVLTVGLTYSIDYQNNLVGIHAAYGSAPNNGLYYAANKEFNYSNPSLFSETRYPASTSWLYQTNSTMATYFSDVPPFARLDCRIVVSGMESLYREAAVVCEING